MVAVPVPPPDSTTSGYSVPCTRNSTPDPLGLRDLSAAPSNDADELAADDLALALRVGDPGQRVEEPLGGIDRHQLDAGRGHVVPLDLLALARPQQTVVDEHAGQLVTDGPMHERGGDGGVHAAGQAADRPARPRSASRISSTSSAMMAGVQSGRCPATSCRNRRSTS